MILLGIFLLGMGAGVNTPHPLNWFMIDTTRTVVPEGNEQTMARIVFDGANFVSVWADNRMTRTGYRTVYGTRIAPDDGKVLDSIGVLITRLPSDREIYELSCASSGVNTLIVWEQRLYVDSAEIKAARVGLDLSVLDSTPIIIDTGNCFYPRVAYGEGGYLIVWLIPGGGIFGRRVSVDGALLDSAPILYYLSGCHIDDYQVASNGRDYLLTVLEHNSGYTEVFLRGIKIDAGGNVTDTLLIYHYEGPAPPRYGSDCEFGICFGNGNYFISFTRDWGGSTYQQILGIRVSSDGVVIDTIPIVIDSVRVLVGYLTTKVAGGDGVYLVLAQFKDGPNDNLYCKRVSAQGVVLDPTLIPIAIGGYKWYAPGVAFGDNHEFMVVWDDDAENIYSARVTPLGKVSSGKVISTAAGTQTDPDVAFDGTNYLFVWGDNRNWNTVPRNLLYGALVNPDGVMLEPGPFVIARYSAPASPKVCFGGESYFAVWTDCRNDPDGDLFGARVTPKGEVLDPEGIPIATAARTERHPSVECGDGHYFVVYEWGKGVGNEIRGARIKFDGTVMDTNGFLISAGVIHNHFPNLAYNGTRFLVVWSNKPGTNSPSVVRGALIDLDSNPMVSDTFRVSFTPEGVYYSEPLAVASDGRDFFVAWPNNRVGVQIAKGTSIGTRISHEGVVLDTAGIFLGGKWPTDMVFDGTDYALVRGMGGKINLSFISQAGVPHDTNGIDLWVSPYRLRRARLAKGNDDRLAVTVCDFIPEPYNTTRAFATFYNRTGVKEPQPAEPSFSHFSVRLFPTVAKDKLEIEYSSNEGQKVRIYGKDGRMVQEITLPLLSKGDRHRVAVDISTLPRGVYFLIPNKGESEKFIILR